MSDLVSGVGSDLDAGMNIQDGYTGLSVALWKGKERISENTYLAANYMELFLLTTLYNLRK